MERQITTSEIVTAGMNALKASIYVCMPGAVVTYYPSTQTADVQPMVNDVRFDLDTGAVVYEPWSVIKAVPVAWPRFGGFTIAGPLQANDPVVLQAFDMDPGPWRAQGRSQHPVNPVDVRRLGGNYWRAVPTDLTGPIGDASAAGAALIIGKDGDPAQVRISAGKLQLGNSGGDALALASLVDNAISTIVTAFNAHVHLSAAPGVVTGPAQTASGSPPPAIPITPAPGSVASSLVKAQ